MTSGSLVATLMIVFRETLEAGLIVGIVLAMLVRLRAMAYVPRVCAGVAAAVGASLVAGWLLSLSTGATQGVWETAIAGVISIAACAVLTHMIFWMDRQSKRIRPELEERVEVAVSRQDRLALALLPFLAVFREGAETVLFLQAATLQSGTASLAGGLLGAALAVAVTALIFVGGRRIPLKTLFRSTGWLLLLMAAGLLAYGIHELGELGWLPALIEHVWDLNPLLNEHAGAGAFLKSLFGYNGNPSLTEVLAYLIYLTIVIRALRRPAPAAAPVSGPAVQRQPVSV